MNARKVLLAILVNLVVLLVGLKLLDIIALKLTPPLSNYVVEAHPDENILSMEVYPYTGLHIRGNAQERGRSIWTDYYKDFDVHSGDKGFFVDFPLSAPPKKQAGEYRVVLVGGSAAQGWGGQSNDKMFYALLQGSLNERLAARHDPRHVRVINLAMGASITYQNYIALNRWAHPLEPDLILSVSGRNDYIISSGNKSDLPYHYQPVLGLVEAAQYSSSPGWIKTLHKAFPALVRVFKLDLLARMYRLDRHTEVMAKRYQQSNALAPQEEAAFYAHAVNSIERDFPGVPVVVVAQPVYRAKNKLLEEGYTPFLAEAAKRFSPKATAVNLDKAWLDDKAIAGQLASYFVEDDCHFNNEGHALIARQLTDILLPIINGQGARKPAAQ